jgi:D-alanine-D-alanine ligase
MAKNILFLKGGGREEHEVSLVTATYLKSQIPSDYTCFEIEVDKDFNWFYNGNKAELNFQKELIIDQEKHPINLVIPCFHGYPGETGHIQAYLEMIGLPFIGCNNEASLICFNKVLTKLWLEKLGVPVTPFLILNSPADQKGPREEFFKEHGKVFVKASNQGSSVGCYPVNDIKELDAKINEAFKYSSFVLLEKLIVPRELEISVYDYQDQVHTSWPCEINCPDKFYSYEEKYSESSNTKTILQAELPDDIVASIQKAAKKAFNGLNLREFCRMDFFYADGEIYLNEINTFPGMTPISMFPKMIEADGINFADFIRYHLDKNLS